MHGGKLPKPPVLSEALDKDHRQNRNKKDLQVSFTDDMKKLKMMS